MEDGERADDWSAERMRCARRSFWRNSRESTAVEVVVDDLDWCRTPIGRV
jgi:hypothetical protein